MLAVAPGAGAVASGRGVVRARWVPALFVVLLAATGPASAQTTVFSDGFESGNLLAWSTNVGGPPLVPPDPYRFTDVDLRDPHVFVDAGPLGCPDFTDDPLPLGLGPSFNDQVETAITTDGDGDGFLDLSFLELFRPLDVAASGGRLDLTSGLCTPPAAATACGPDPLAVPVTAGYDAGAAGPCLGVVPGSTSGYVPAVTEPPGPCFSSRPRAVVLVLQGVELPLEDFQVAATFVGAPPPGDLAPGLMRGFLREDVADAVLLPPDIPVVGGQPLSVLLPGGAGNCAPGDDRDLHLGVSGWWFYLEGPAAVVPYSGS